MNVGEHTETIQVEHSPSAGARDSQRHARTSLVPRRPPTGGGRGVVWARDYARTDCQIEILETSANYTDINFNSGLRVCVASP